MKPPGWIEIREYHRACPTPDKPGHDVPHLDITVRARWWHPAYWVFRWRLRHAR